MADLFTKDGKAALFDPYVKKPVMVSKDLVEERMRQGFRPAGRAEANKAIAWDEATLGQAVGKGLLDAVTVGVGSAALVKAGLADKDSMEAIDDKFAIAKAASEVTGAVGLAVASGGTSLIAKGAGLAGYNLLGRTGVMASKAAQTLVRGQLAKKAVGFGAKTAVEGGMVGGIYGAAKRAQREQDVLDPNEIIKDFAGGAAAYVGASAVQAFVGGIGSTVKGWAKNKQAKAIKDVESGIDAAKLRSGLVEAKLEKGRVDLQNKVSAREQAKQELDNLGAHISGVDDQIAKIEADPLYTLDAKAAVNASKTRIQQAHKEIKMSRRELTRDPVVAERYKRVSEEAEALEGAYQSQRNRITELEYGGVKPEHIPKGKGEQKRLSKVFDHDEQYLKASADVKAARDRKQLFGASDETVENFRAVHDMHKSVEYEAAHAAGIQKQHAQLSKTRPELETKLTAGMQKLKSADGSIAVAERTLATQANEVKILGETMKQLDDTLIKTRAGGLAAVAEAMKRSGGSISGRLGFAGAAAAMGGGLAAPVTWVLAPAVTKAVAASLENIAKSGTYKALASVGKKVAAVGSKATKKSMFFSGKSVMAAGLTDWRALSEEDNRKLKARAQKALAELPRIVDEALSMGAPPDEIGELATRQTNVLTYLSENMPEHTAPDAEKRAFSERLQVALDPNIAFAKFDEGRGVKNAVHALKGAHPDVYDDYVSKLVGAVQMAQINGVPVDRKTKKLIADIVGKPADGAISRQVQQAYQKQPEAERQRQRPVGKTYSESNKTEMQRTITGG